MFRISAATCAAGLVAGLVLAAPTAAQARSATIEDGTGDVWTAVWNDEIHDHEWVLDEIENADVTRSVVKHTDRVIAITASYADLTNDSDYAPAYGSWFKLDDGREAWLSIGVTEQWKPSTWITVQKVAGGKWNKNLECPGLDARWHWQTDQVTARIPRSCFGDPKWIRFHGVSLASKTDPAPDYQMWSDNAHTDGRDDNPSDPYTERLKAG
jgi:hypothetical protein